MTRSSAREIALHFIYAMECTGEKPEEILSVRLADGYYDCLAEENAVYSERPNRKQRQYVEEILRGVDARRDSLNQYISQYAIGWNINRISRLAKAILQLAIYESLHMEDVPVGVAINEAVELAKKYESEEVVAFVNGILGSFSRGQTQKNSCVKESRAEELEPSCLEGKSVMQGVENEE